MLAVGIHHQHERSTCAAQPGLDGRAVPLVIRVPNHQCAGSGRPLGGSIGRTIVDDDDLVPSRGTCQLADEPSYGVRLVVRGDENGCLLGEVGHSANLTSYRKTSERSLAEPVVGASPPRSLASSCRIFYRLERSSLARLARSKF